VRVGGSSSPSSFRQVTHYAKSPVRGCTAGFRRPRGCGCPISHFDVSQKSLSQSHRIENHSMVFAEFVSLRTKFAASGALTIGCSSSIQALGNHSSAFGTGAHDVGCHGRMRSSRPGSVLSPSTQLCISADQDTMACNSPFFTRIGVPSNGADSIGSQSSASGSAASSDGDICPERFRCSKVRLPAAALGQHKTKMS
jgi:hypothetical protein